MLHIRYPFGELEVTDDLMVSLNGRALEPGSRTLSAMYEVLCNPKAVVLPGETVLYRMFRNAIQEKHAEIFRRRRIRFDITVMAPLLLGEELNKTLGHYHPNATEDLTYPEIYQVLHGQATYLLQRAYGGIITDFIVLEAAAGDAVLIPPNHGHVTVNSGEEPLVMANLVSSTFSSLYEGYIIKGGAAYYLLKGGRIMPNPKYCRLPEPRFSKERFTVSKDLYTDFIYCPSCFSYLNDPSELENLI
ncbi:MAG: glucose-6-phosphate isomerase [Candidatus Verstraetearchaeota archaeon]|nr:glucose-6-phosphate isomerase [Candidatus Verstraetearchaeota archaeon]